MAANIHYDASGTLQAVKRFTPSNQASGCYYTCPESFVASNQVTYTFASGIFPSEGINRSGGNTSCGYSYLYVQFSCVIHVS